MDELVSIIVPAYNSEKTLNRCINSIIEQTYSNIELIIVNDGSVDKTAEICDEYSIGNDRVKIIHKANEGVSSARNAGLDIAKGSYIFFIDSDDAVEYNYIEELMKWKEYDFVTAGFQWQNTRNEWNYRIFINDSLLVSNLKKNPSKYMGKYYFGSPWSKLFKRDIIEEYNIKFNTSINSGEDTLFIFDYLEHVKNLKIIPIAGYKYYFYKNSLVHQVHPDYWKWRIALEKQIRIFFDTTQKDEVIFFYEKFFDVLVCLLSMYKNLMNKTELFELYQNPFFKESVSWKWKNGSIKEKFLIFCMERKLYYFYDYTCKVILYFKSVISKLNRIYKKIL